MVVEPIAQITSLGEWESLPCNSRNNKDCIRFEGEYLSKPHSYTVISSDGSGALIQAAPVKLSECYGYDGIGTYSGADIHASAISASSPELFGLSSPPQRLDQKTALPILKRLASSVPKKLDSTRYLHLSSIQLEGQSLLVLQRAFADYAFASEQHRLDLIFAIGKLGPNGLQILHWKQTTDDEDERVLGTIHLKSGKEFLISVVSDPESQSFRAYGIVAGKLTLVWSGGGSSC